MSTPQRFRKKPVAMEPIDQLLIEFEEQERWRDLLGEVLAVLNRDGGHYQAKHGAGRAAIEGVRSHYQMLTTIDALQAENARLREQAEALAEALTRIAEGDAESYLSCPGVPICSRTHDDNCGVGIAVAALRAYRGADPPEGDDEYGMVKDAEQVADHLPPGWKL